MEKKLSLFGVSPSPHSWDRIKQHLDLQAYNGTSIGIDISDAQLKELEHLPKVVPSDYIGNPKLALARQVIAYAREQKLKIIPLKVARADKRRVREEKEWLTSKMMKKPDGQATEYLIESGIKMRVKKFQPNFVIVNAARMSIFNGIPHHTVIDDRGFLEKHSQNLMDRMRKRQILRRARNIKKIRKRNAAIRKH